jgi:hypothetical protein
MAGINRARTICSAENWIRVIWKFENEEKSLFPVSFSLEQGNGKRQLGPAEAYQLSNPNNSITNSCTRVQGLWFAWSLSPA